jgi:hypothetical protein
MQTSGFVDQLFDVHRDRNAFRDAGRLPALAEASAAFAICAASKRREWISVKQATIASLKTGLAMSASPT